MNFPKENLVLPTDDDIAPSRNGLYKSILSIAHRLPQMSCGSVPILLRRL